jgi:hypothetical protein
MGGGVYWPRNDTEDHGIGEGMIGWLARGGFTTKDTEGTKRTGGNRGGKLDGDYKCSNRLRAKALTGEWLSSGATE